MSMLDQAFIKAYRKGVAGPAHSVSNRTWPAARQVPPVEVATYGAPHQGVPTPHANFRAAAVRPAPTPMAATQPPVVEPVIEPTPAATETPHESLRPAFEVPRFAWPAIVDRLISAAFTEFSGLGSLLASRHREGRKALLVSGCCEGEGRSTLALALARVASTRGLHVALVDADFSRPHLAELLGVVVQVGWEDVFGGNELIGEALVESVQERVTLLALRSTVEHPQLLAGQRRLVQSLATLRQSYDLVILDSGPLDSDAAALDLATAFAGAAIDDALVLRDAGQSTTDDLKLVGRRLAAAGIACWDLAENFADASGSV